MNPSAELDTLRKMRGENPLAKMAEELAAEERRVRGKKQGIGEILMRLGLGMAASRRPDFLGAIGEGGIGALQGFMQNRQLTQQQADELQRRRLAVMERVQGSEDVLMREAGDIARAKANEQTANAYSVQANRRAMMQQYGENQRAEERRIFEMQKQQIDAAADLAKESARNAADLKKIDQQKKMAIEVLEAEKRLGSDRFTQSGGGGGGSTREDKQLNTLDLAINRNNVAIESLYKRRNTAPANQQDAIDKRIAELEFRGDRLIEGQMIRMEELGIVPGIQFQRPPRQSSSASNVPPPPAATRKPRLEAPRGGVPSSSMGVNLMSPNPLGDPRLLEQWNRPQAPRTDRPSDYPLGLFQY